MAASTTFNTTHTSVTPRIARDTSSQQPKPLPLSARPGATFNPCNRYYSSSYNSSYSSSYNDGYSNYFSNRRGKPVTSGNKLNAALVSRSPVQSLKRRLVTYSPTDTCFPSGGTDITPELRHLRIQ